MQIFLELAAQLKQRGQVNSASKRVVLSNSSRRISPAYRSGHQIRCLFSEGFSRNGTSQSEHLMYWSIISRLSSSVSEDIESIESVGSLFGTRSRMSAEIAREC